MPETPNSFDPFEEIANANRGLTSSRDWDRLEFMPQLRGRRAAEVYREMEQNDALVGAILFAIEMLLRRVEWDVEPFSKEQADIDRADFLYSCMDDMSITWEEVVALALSMLPYGYAWMEIVYKKRLSTDIDAPAEHRTRYPDGKIGWRKFSLLPQATIDEIEEDEHGGVTACRQGSYGLDRVFLPIEKSLLFRTDTRSPRGKSVLRNVVESWYYRKRIREIEGVGISRDLEGFPVMHVDASVLANPTRVDEYKRILNNLRRDDQEGLLLPALKEEGKPLEPLAKLELVASGGKRQFDTSVIIQRYSREIAVALLQDIVLLGHEKVGTQALASEKRDLSDTALQTWLNLIASIFNTHAVPRLFALNGESVENLPKMVPGELRPTDVNEFAAAIRDLAAGGIVFDNPEDEQEARRRVGMPPMPPEDLSPREPEDEPEEPETDNTETPNPSEELEAA